MICLSRMISRSTLISPLTTVPYESHILYVQIFFFFFGGGGLGGWGLTCEPTYAQVDVMLVMLIKNLKQS